MKKVFIGLLVLLLISAFTLRPPLNSISGYWKLICYEDVVLNQMDCRPVDEYFSRKLTFKFNDDGKHGKITGSTTTNKVFGEYQLFENQTLKVNSFGGTKIGEHGWGKDFWTKISQASSYKNELDTLLIYYESDTKAMKFIPVVE